MKLLDSPGANRRPRKGWLWLLGASLLWAACSAREAQSRFDESLRYFDAGDYLSAVQGFEAVVRDYPKSAVAARALHMTGRIYSLYLEQNDRALNAYQRLVQNYPRSPYAPWAQLSRSEIYHYTYEDYGRAVLEYQRLLSLFPDFPQPDRIHYRIAACLLEMHNFTLYRTKLKYLLEQYPDSAWADDAALGLAESYYLEGQPEFALTQYREFIRDYPDSPLLIQARFGVAKSLEESMRLEEAIQVYKELLPDYPNSNLIQERLAVVEKRLQDRNR